MTDRFETYYCKNGEKVLVEINPDNHKEIFVYYNQKRYVKPTSIIGKTLFKSPLSEHATSVLPQNTISQPTCRKAPTIKKSAPRQRKKPKSFTLKPTLNTESISVGSVVTLYEHDTEEEIKIFLCDTEIRFRTKRMGGAYYGNSVEAFETSDAGEVLQDDIVKVSISSPMEKAVSKGKIGERIHFVTPDMRSLFYTILDVEQTDL